MISVLIRAGDDRVSSCIASIKKTSPTSKILASLVPNKKLEKEVKKYNIKYCVVPRKSGSMTTNKGLALVKTNKVLITDSDTIFDKNCISLLDNALNKYEVVKAHIIFQNNGSLQSVLVANLRTYFNSKNQKMYTPGLAFKMSIKRKIGGYYFDNKVAWSDDSEFSDRVEVNGLKTYLEKKANMFHPPVRIGHDLASAFLFGAKKPETKTLPEIISKRLIRYSEILKNFGVLTLIYGLIWHGFFDFGKLTKHMGKTGKKIQDYFWKL